MRSLCFALNMSVSSFVFLYQVTLYSNARVDKHYTNITSAYHSCEIGIWSSMDFGAEIIRE